MNPVVIVTARAFDFPPELLLGQARRRELVKARAAAVSVLRTLTTPGSVQPISYPKIGAMFELRDHSSVMYLAKRARDFATDPEWCACRDRIATEMAAIYAGATPPEQQVEVRHPAVLTKPCKPRNERAAGDKGAMQRFRGAQALLEAIRREHPERFRQAA